MTQTPPQAAEPVTPTSQEAPSDVFARRLRTERERQRMTQAQLARGMADFLGTPIYTTVVTRIETGDRIVRLDHAVAAAATLQIPLQALISAEDATPAQDQIEEAERELATAQQNWLEQRDVVIRKQQALMALTGGLEPAMARSIDQRADAAAPGQNGSPA